MREKINDEQFWKNVPQQHIITFLKENPMKYSAELNSFLSFVQNKLGLKRKNFNLNDETIKKQVKEYCRNVVIFLIYTNTPTGELAKKILEKYFKKELGIKNIKNKEIEGYFKEEVVNYFGIIYDEEKKQKEKFVEGVPLLLDIVLYVIFLYKRKGYEIYLNVTGGMKPHVLILGIAGFLTRTKLYYLHEEFSRDKLALLSF